MLFNRSLDARGSAPGLCAATSSSGRRWGWLEQLSTFFTPKSSRNGVVGCPWANQAVHCSSRIKNSPVSQHPQARPRLGREQPLPSSSSEPPARWARAEHRICSSGQQQELNQGLAELGEAGRGVPVPGDRGWTGSPEALGVAQGFFLTSALNNKWFCCISVLGRASAGNSQWELGNRKGFWGCPEFH